MAFIECGISSGGGGEKILVDTWNTARGGNQSKEIDCTSVPNYQNLTADDFDIDVSGTTFQIDWWGGQWNTTNLTFAKAYNPTTGKLTVSLTRTGNGNLDTPIGSVKVVGFDSAGGGGSQGITESELVASITPGAQRTYTYTFPNNYDDYKNFLFTVVATGVTVSFTNMSEISSYVLGNSMTKLFAPDGNAIPTITLTGTDAYNDMRFVIYGLK